MKFQNFKHQKVKSPRHYFFIQRTQFDKQINSSGLILFSKLNYLIIINKYTMTRILFVFLLLVLPCHFKQTRSFPQDPFDGKSYTIFSNILEMTELNGIEVTFKDKSISFNGCNLNRGGYILSEGNVFATAMWSSTKMLCQSDNDDIVQQLFSNSVSYSLGDKSVSFKNQIGEQLMILKEK